MDPIDSMDAVHAIRPGPTTSTFFVVPGDSIKDVENHGVLHVDSSSHIVSSRLLAATTGYARVNEVKTTTSTSTSVTIDDVATRRYKPRKSDPVLGVVTKQGNAEYHEIDIGRGANRPTLLPVLGFDNATKRNRPMLKPGDVVYGKIVEEDSDRVVMDCVNTRGGEEAEGYGPIPGSGSGSGSGSSMGGLVCRVTPGYARWLLDERTGGGMEVLRVLGGKVPFEIVIGVNGMFWIASQEKERERAFLETCILGSAIGKIGEIGEIGETAVSSGGEVRRGDLQRRVLEVLKKEMEER